MTDAELEAWKKKIENSSDDSGKTTWESMINDLKSRIAKLNAPLPPPRLMVFKPRLVAGSVTGISAGMTGLSLSFKIYDWSLTGLSVGGDILFGAAQAISGSSVILTKGCPKGLLKHIICTKGEVSVLDKYDKLLDSCNAALDNAIDALKLAN